jgi:hypothetical protein
VITTFYGLGYSAVLRAFEEMDWDIFGFVLHKCIFIGLIGLVRQTDLGLRGFRRHARGQQLPLPHYWQLVRIRHGRAKLSFDLRAGWALLVESFPLGLAEILRRLTWHGDKVLLGRFGYTCRGRAFQCRL